MSGFSTPCRGISPINSAVMSSPPELGVSLKEVVPNMTHCSLFKEAAQRIVQSAQASQNNGFATLRSAGHEPRSDQPVQMSNSSFNPPAQSISADKSKASSG